MPDLPAPAAPRLARPRWLDARLVVGLLLVLASVVLGARVVAAADDAVPVWAVTADLGPGTRLGEDDLVRRDVRLDAGAARYVSAAGAPPVGWVLTRAVGDGELLPAAAVAREGAQDLRRLPVEVDPVSATGLRDHAVVDLYVVPGAGPGDAAPPASEPVLEGVTVDEVAERTGGLAPGSRGGSVVLLVTPEGARAVLDAQARGALRLLQVPVGAS
ncbi:hypothetical protein [Vallicoccus soli]|uniref:SAF domain-containing protein n=1 Tax=Vallicoccus soli TaxID=2339232 RepID=A0A3A3Z1R7_9ACTN|nr:hypothetical protein [Vallicoccus soli]RJK95418.1 hypothetical protein D5H78_12235 [Vallicoccus soli]